MGAVDGSTPEGSGGREDVGPERLAMFSDGVFAIAITLLVLPLTEAEIEPGHIAADLRALVPQMLTFGLSFAVIGRYWMVHHQDVRRIARVDDRLLVLNLAFLLCVAFLPFPTSVLGKEAETASVVLYAATIIAAALTATALVRYAAARRLTTPSSDGEVRAAFAGGTATALAFAPSIPLAFVSPPWAMVSWLLTIPFGMAADRIVRRRRRRPDGEQPR